MKHLATIAAALTAGALPAGWLRAQEQAEERPAAPVECQEVSFSDVGWTDITVTTTAAAEVMRALGYEVDVRVLSVPITFASLATGETDVFLGNWMPTQQSAILPYIDEGRIETINENLTGTIYNLAVPAYTYEKGLQTYEDLSDFAEELDRTIYGIEPGNEGNSYLVGLIEEDRYGLGEFSLRESSEQGMLSQVSRAVQRKEDIVFLGWAPHPMNENFDIAYLEGGEEFFGGKGSVYTVTREGFVGDCPNAGRLLEQMDFTLEMENSIMGKILDDGTDPQTAVSEWIAENPGVLEDWLRDVTTTQGEPGLPAVREAFGVS